MALRRCWRYLPLRGVNRAARYYYGERRQVAYAAARRRVNVSGATWVLLSCYGGDSADVADQLDSDAVSVYNTGMAFVRSKRRTPMNGIVVVTWGIPSHGCIISTRLQAQLAVGVARVYLRNLVRHWVVVTNACRAVTWWSGYDDGAVMSGRFLEHSPSRTRMPPTSSSIVSRLRLIRSR